MFLRLLFITAISLILSLAQAQAQDITWEPPYRGDDPDLLYLPDTKATYWRYGWTRKPGDTTGFVISGQTPDVRYFSYNIYDDNIKASLGSFTDFQIKSDDGTINPFKGNSGGSKSNYKIYILPEGTETVFDNVLYFPDDLTNVSVFLRHYVAKNNIQGDAPLPKIEQFNTKTMTASPAAMSSKIPAISKQEVQKYLIPMLKKMVNHFEQDPEAMIKKLASQRTGEALDIKELVASQVVAKTFNLFETSDTYHSLRFQTAGTYPNKDNYYLGLPIIRKKEQSLLVRFKVPQVAKTMADYPDVDVRYYSLSQGDEHSYTHGTIMDSEMQTDHEGFANFIISDDTPEVRAKAKDMGVNFMPWKVGNKMLLIYRHMLPNSNFEFGINNVPSFVHDQRAEDQYAYKTIGSYAMSGKLVETKSIFDMTLFPEF